MSFKINHVAAALSVSLVFLFPACGRTEKESNASSHGRLIIISSAGDFTEKVGQSDHPVLVDFWATWCPPCRKMNPILAEMSERHHASLKIAKVDVDQNRELAQEFKIESIPTMILFHQGKAIGQLVGAMDEGDLESWIKQQLQPLGLTL